MRFDSERCFCQLISARFSPICFPLSGCDRWFGGGNREPGPAFVVPTAKCAAKAKANAKGKPKANPKVKAAVKSSPHPKGKAQAKPKSKRANTERTKTYNRIYSKVYRQVRSAGEAWRKPKGWVVMLRLSTFLREELDCQLLMEF